MTKSITKSIVRDTMELEIAMPEKADVSQLEIYQDIIFTDGLKAMREIIKTSTKEESKIKAFNSTVSFGKYLEVRKLNTIKKDDLEFDDPTMILTEDEG